MGARRVAYRLLADWLVLTHAAYVLFVVLGQMAILVGLTYLWTWARNFWFRTIHLAMIGVVVVEAISGIACPLTVWEKELRRLAGQVSYPGDFLGHWVHRMLFFQAEPWVFTLVYSLFGLLVLGTFVLAPPRRRGGCGDRP
jgi:hypothetical protein